MRRRSSLPPEKYFRPPQIFLDHDPFYPLEAMAKKHFKEFVSEIPDVKLQDFPESGGTIYPSLITDDNFRLDMQGVRICYVAFELAVMGC